VRLFFQLVSTRYERGSIILTSNKSYGGWGSIFGDPIIATAILDRLLHHSTTINNRGESYWLKDRRKAGLFPRPEEEGDRPAPFPSPEILQNGPRRQGSAYLSEQPGYASGQVHRQRTGCGDGSRKGARHAHQHCLHRFDGKHPASLAA
jgi:IstB-like ATP binding protein